MKPLGTFSKTALALFALWQTPVPAPAATLTTLFSFNGTNGAEPRSGLAMDKAGNLYGTASYGGPWANAKNDGYGTVFKLSPPAAGQTAWTRTTLFNFNGTNGAIPNGRLVIDAAGNLYGTTINGGTEGNGTAFKLRPPAAGQTAWTRATLFNFTGKTGAEPMGGLVMDAARNLYGLASDEGAGGSGSVFKLSPPAPGQTAWTQAILSNLNMDKLEIAEAGLLLDAGGNLYGATFMGGAYGGGMVFKLRPPTAGQTAWTRTVLANFKGAGFGGPMASLVADAAGNLYGTTSSGGTYGLGTVFKLSPPAPGKATWALSTIASFKGSAVPSQAGLAIDAAGNLYGTTAGGGVNNSGTVFKLRPPAAGQTAWTWTALASFNGANGSSPDASLLIDAAGNLYGATTYGGAYGYGTVFKISP